MKPDGVQTGEKRRRGSSAPLRHAAGVTNDTLSHHKETRRPRRGRTSHASPPDPTWISGIYDDADYDDVVCLITTGHGTIETVGLANAHPLLPVAGWVSALESDLGPGLSGFSSPSRAPLAY